MRSTVKYMDSVTSNPDYELSRKILSKVLKRDDGEDFEDNEVDAKLLFRQETDIFNNNEYR